MVVDFGSNTTRAGFAGEDGPRIVTPSFYGYIDAEGSGSSNGAEDAPADGDDPMSGTGEDKKEGDKDGEKKGKRKYYFGDDGAGVWRPNMEVGNFVVDGIGEYGVVGLRRARCVASRVSMRAALGTVCGGR